MATVNIEVESAHAKEIKITQVFVGGINVTNKHS